MTDTLLEQIRGNTLDRTITITDNTGAPINITGWTFVFSVKKNKTDIAYVFQVNATIVNATGGIVRIVVPASTMTIAPCDYVYDVEYTNAWVVRTILRGTLRISYNVG